MNEEIEIRELNSLADEYAAKEDLNTSLSTTDEESDTFTFKNFIAVAAAVICTMMVYTLENATNFSITQIQSSLSVTLDEIGWINTFYIIGELIMAPITLWLAKIFTTRRYFFSSTALFVIFSICCGFANNIYLLVFFRTLQGLSAGAMNESAVIVTLTTFGKKRRAAFAVIMGFLPLIIRLLACMGGWVTDTFGWRFIYFMNVVPGIIMLMGIYYAVEKEKSDLELLKKGDWLGIVSLMTGLVAFELMISHGDKLGWFDSNLIIILLLIGLIFTFTATLSELNHKNPFIRLKLLKIKNFAIVNCIEIVDAAAGMFYNIISTLYLIEVFGYTTLQTATVFLLMVLPFMVFTVIIPPLIERFDPRLTYLAGQLFSVVIYLLIARLGSGAEMIFIIYIMLIGLGAFLAETSVVMLTLVDIEEDDVKDTQNISVLSVLTGKFLGTSLAYIILSNREKFHYSILSENIHAYSNSFQETYNSLQSYFGSEGTFGTEAGSQALHVIRDMVVRQSYIMSFNDCYYLLAVVSLVTCLPVLFLKKSS